VGKRRDSSDLLDMEWWRSQWTEAEWSSILANGQCQPESIRRATYTGRPLGSADFVADLERRLGRKLKRQKAGRPKHPPSPVLGGQLSLQAAENW
jgi:hypothetical protein